MNTRLRYRAVAPGKKSCGLAFGRASVAGVAVPVHYTQAERRMAGLQWLKGAAMTVAVAALPFATQPARAQTAVGTGTGLHAEYYDNADLTSLKLTRTDPTINFQWGAGAPAAGMGDDTFSARWTGFVQPRYSQTYTFTTVADNGARLWVNGKLLIDQWSTAAPRTNSATIALVAGTRYDIKMEYFESLLGAAAQLFWASPSQAQEIIPQSQLYPTAALGTRSLNVPPSAVLTAPAAISTFVAPASFRLAANASDVDGTVAKVEFFNGSTLVATQNAAPYDANIANLPAGTYTFTAKATDNLGAATVSSPIVVTVSPNAAPAVSLTAPINNSSAVGPASLQITAAASDRDGKVAKVEFFQNNVLVGTKNYAPYSATVNGLGAGTYTFTAKATDNLGAVTNSVPVAVTVTGNVAPTIAITSPSTGSRSLPTSSIHLTANAADADGKVSKVEFFKNGTLIGSQGAAPWDCWTGQLPLGTYAFTARATDNKGAVTTSAPVSVLVALNEAPVVAIANPLDGATLDVANPVNVQVNASDIDGTVTRVQYFADNQMVGDSTQGTWNLPWTTNIAGTHAFFVKAMDNRGAWTTSATSTVTLQRTTPIDPLVLARFPRLTRGINIEEWFKYGYQPTINNADLDTIVTMGFKHVRVPIGVHALFDENDPDHPNAALLSHLDDALDMILAHDLAVIICPFDADNTLYTDGPVVDKFARCWRALAAHLSSRRPDRVFLETLNEPFSDKPWTWDVVQNKLIAAIRQGAPNHTIIASANMNAVGAGSQVEAITEMVPSADTNVVYNFHFYKPSTFTHQGCEWGNAAWLYLHDLPYPSNPDNVAPILPTITDPAARDLAKTYGDENWNAAKLESYLAPVAAWAALNKVKVTCNEFGVYRPGAPNDDRIRCLTDVRTLLEKYNIGWAMWEYDNYFGIVNTENGHHDVDDATASALGLY